MKRLIFIVMLLLTSSSIALENIGIGQDVNIEVKKFIAPELEVSPNCSTTTCVQSETISGDLIDREEIDVDFNGTDFVVISPEESEPNSLVRYVIVLLLIIAIAIIWEREKKKKKEKEKKRWE